MEPISPEDVKKKSDRQTKITGVKCRSNPKKLTSIIAMPDVTDDVEDIINMVNAGMNVACIELDKSRHAQQLELIMRIRKAELLITDNKESIYPIAIAAQIGIPSVKTGLVDDKLSNVMVNDGSTIIVTSDINFYHKCNVETIYINEKYLHDLNGGMKIYIDKGRIVLTCIVNTSPYCVCKIEKGGLLKSCMDVVIPDLRHRTNKLSEEDLSDIKFAIDIGVDSIILHEPTEETILHIKNKIFSCDNNIMLLSKLCYLESLLDLDGIVKLVDGIILNPSYSVPDSRATKYLTRLGNVIDYCNQEGLPVYFIGQQFLNHTKLGLTDCSSSISNAIRHGVDGIVLLPSKICESSDSIANLNAICRYSEPLYDAEEHFWNLTCYTDIMQTIGVSSCLISYSVNATCIIIVSTVFYTSLCVSRAKPPCPILSVLNTKSAARKLQFYRGIIPLYYPGAVAVDWREEASRRVGYAAHYALHNKMLRVNDTIIVITDAALQSGQSGNQVSILKLKKDGTFSPY